MHLACMRYQEQKSQIRDRVLSPLDINMLVLKFRARWNQIAKSDGSVEERQLVDIRTRSSNRLSDTAQSEAVPNLRLDSGITGGRGWKDRVCQQHDM